MTTIQLNFNYGFKWFCKGGLSVKGFLFDDEDNFYTGTELLQYFKNILDKTEFQERVQKANGLFSVILDTGQNLFAAVDRLRSFPIFYLRQEGNLFLSDDAGWLAKQQKKCTLNELRVAEFLSTGFVTGNNTLLNDIFQIRTGSVFYFDRTKVQQDYYHLYYTRQINTDGYEKQRAQLIIQIENSFNRFIKSLQGRSVALSLSGGFDSRLIAVMLKEAGYKNVVCYTYGHTDSPEIPYARKISEILDFDWHFIHYNSERISNFMLDPTFDDYYRFSANYSSMFFMENYFALKYLSEKKIVSSDTIFTAGHSGDFLGGSQLLKNGNIGEEAPASEIARQIYTIKYSLLKNTAEMERYFFDEIEATISVVRQTGSPPLAYSLFENWDLKEKLAKFIFNSSNVYNFFGYEHRHPFMDNSLFNFFKEAPYSFKFNKLLYDDVLKNHFFKKYDLDFEKEIQPDPIIYSIQKIKSRFRPYLPNIIKEIFSRKNDPNNYAKITSDLVNDLKKRGIKVDKSGKNFNSIIVQWYIKQIQKELIEDPQ